MQVLAHRLGLLKQALALCFRGFAPFPLAGERLLVRCVRRVQHIEKAQTLMAVEVSQATLGEQPAGRERERTGARDKRASAVVSPSAAQSRSRRRGRTTRHRPERLRAEPSAVTSRTPGGVAVSRASVKEKSAGR